MFNNNLDRSRDILKPQNNSITREASQKSVKNGLINKRQKFTNEEFPNSRKFNLSLNLSTSKNCKSSNFQRFKNAVNTITSNARSGNLSLIQTQNVGILKPSSGNLRRHKKMPELNTSNISHDKYRPGSKGSRKRRKHNKNLSMTNSILNSSLFMK